jgi:hypothetical protein
VIRLPTAHCPLPACPLPTAHCPLAHCPLPTAQSAQSAQSAIGEEFLYCVKADGFADGSAASGRACDLRPVPPYAAPHGNDSTLPQS